MNEIVEDFYLALRIVKADIGLKNSILAQADMDEKSREAMVHSVQCSEKLLTKYEKYIEVEGEL